MLKPLILTLPLLFIAGVVGAYTPPNGAAPTENTPAPIMINTTPQVKSGNLTVTTFQGRGNSWLQQRSFMNGLVRGGTTTDIISTVTFGSDTHSVNVEFTRDVYVDGYISSEGLSGVDESRVCTDATGTLYRCTVATTPGTGTIALSLFTSDDDNPNNDAYYSEMVVRNTTTQQDYMVDISQTETGDVLIPEVTTTGSTSVPYGPYQVHSFVGQGYKGSTVCTLTPPVGSVFTISSTNTSFTGSVACGQ